MSITYVSREVYVELSHSLQEIPDLFFVSFPTIFLGPSNVISPNKCLGVSSKLCIEHLYSSSPSCTCLRIFFVASRQILLQVIVAFCLYNTSQIHLFFSRRSSSPQMACPTTLTSCQFDTLVKSCSLLNFWLFDPI